MASVGFGSTVAAVAPASSSAVGRRRPRRSVLAAPPAATRGSPAPAKEEKSITDFIFGAIFKKDQLLVETDPLLNKVDGGGAPSKARSGGTTGGGKKAAAASGDNGGFNFGGLFAKKG